MRLGMLKKGSVPNKLLSLVLSSVLALSTFGISVGLPAKAYAEDAESLDGLPTDASTVDSRSGEHGFGCEVSGSLQNESADEGSLFLSGLPASSISPSETIATRQGVLVTFCNSEGADLYSGSTLHVGDSVIAEVSVNDNDSLRFNYVWVRNGNWSDGSWSSTINERGASTLETSWMFNPDVSGQYTVYVDTYYADGSKSTSTGFEVKVVEDWEFGGFDVSSKAVALGDAVAVDVSVFGEDADYARFNYVWNYRGDWSNWSSVELETGCPTAARSWSFEPQRAGVYQIYIDAVRTDGTRETRSTSITVESSWVAEGIILTSNGTPLTGDRVALGDPLEATVDMKEGSNLTGLTYNFVWQKGSSWEKGEWDSLENQGLSDKTGSHVYQLSSIGKYNIYVDVIGTDGKKQTLSADIEVGYPYTVMGVQLLSVPGDSAEAGEVLQNNTIGVSDSVLVSPKATGDIERATFNYVWSYEGSWEVGEWDSTVNRTSKTTEESSWIFTPDKYGSYDIYVDVIASDGSKQTFGTELIVSRGWDPGTISIDKKSPQLTGTNLTILPVSRVRMLNTFVSIMCACATAGLIGRRI